MKILFILLILISQIFLIINCQVDSSDNSCNQTTTSHTSLEDADNEYRNKLIILASDTAEFLPRYLLEKDWNIGTVLNEDKSLVVEPILSDISQDVSSDFVNFTYEFKSNVSSSQDFGIEGAYSLTSIPGVTFFLDAARKNSYFSTAYYKIGFTDITLLNAIEPYKLISFVDEHIKQNSYVIYGIYKSDINIAFNAYDECSNKLDIDFSIGNELYNLGFELVNDEDSSTSEFYEIKSMKSIAFAFLAKRVLSTEYIPKNINTQFDSIRGDITVTWDIPNDADKSRIYWGSDENISIYDRTSYNEHFDVEGNYYNLSIKLGELENAFCFVVTSFQDDSESLSSVVNCLIPSDHLVCNDKDFDGYYPQVLCDGLVDCNDHDEEVFPKSVEICNDNKDNNCDDNFDCFDPDCYTSTDCECIDEDNDGFYSNNNCGSLLDCNDSISQINPAAIEIVGDGIDNDCDGETDEIIDNPSLSENLKAYYSFNGYYSGAYCENSNEEVIGDIEFVPGQNLAAIRFDTIGEKLVANSDFISNTQDSLSISFWFKLNDSYLEENDSFTFIILKDSIEPRSRFAFSIEGEGPGENKTFRFIQWKQTSETSAIGLPLRVVNEISENVWHHIVCMYDQLGVLHLYYNDQLIDTRNGHESIPNLNELEIGIVSQSCSDESCDPIISVDELSIYNRSLSEEEISQLYNGSTLGLICVGDA